MVPDHALELAAYFSKSGKIANKIPARAAQNFANTCDINAHFIIFICFGSAPTHAMLVFLSRYALWNRPDSVEVDKITEAPVVPFDGCEGVLCSGTCQLFM